MGFGQFDLEKTTKTVVAQDTLPAYLPVAGGVRPVGFTAGPSRSNGTQAKGGSGAGRRMPI